MLQEVRVRVVFLFVYNAKYLEQIYAHVLTTDTWVCF